MNFRLTSLRKLSIICHAWCSQQPHFLAVPQDGTQNSAEWVHSSLQRLQKWSYNKAKDFPVQAELLYAHLCGEKLWEKIISGAFLESGCWNGSMSHLPEQCHGTGLLALSVRAFGHIIISTIFCPFFFQTFSMSFRIRDIFMRYPLIFYSFTVQVLKLRKSCH